MVPPSSPSRWSIQRAAQWQQWWRPQITDDPLIRAAARQGFVLTPAQLAALGVSRSAARTALRHGRWSAPSAGTVTPLSLAEPLSSAQAADRRGARGCLGGSERPGPAMSCPAAARRSCTDCRR